MTPVDAPQLRATGGDRDSASHVSRAGNDQSFTRLILLEDRSAAAPSREILPIPAPNRRRRRSQHFKSATLECLATMIPAPRPEARPFGDVAEAEQPISDTPVAVLGASPEWPQ